MKPLLFTALLAGVLLTTTGCDDSPNEGNADVFAFTLDFDLDEATQDGVVAAQGYTLPEITANVVDNGTVLVYYRFADTWTALPYTISVEAANDPPRVDYSATFGYGYDDAFLEVFVEASTDDPVVWEELEDSDVFRGGTLLKVVVINALPVNKTAEVDFRDYEAVKAYYNLPD